jgi:hypothetical protein
MRFAAPSAQPTGRVHLPRVCLTRYVPSSGFHALLTASSSTGSRPCFVPERSWSSDPFRAFPSLGAAASLDADLPSCRSTVRLGPEGPRAPEAASPCRSGRFMKRPGARRRDVRRFAHPSTTGLCSPWRVRCANTGGWSGDRLDALLGFGPLQGIPPRCHAPVSPPSLLPRAWPGLH